MSPKHIAAYTDFRRTIFDVKGECSPLPFAASEATLIKAASSVGRAEGLTPLSGGTFHSCFRFDTVDGTFVLRVPSNEQLAPNLLCEEWAANAAREVHFPALVPVLTDTSHYLAPFSFQILPFVEGPSDAMRLGRLSRLHKVNLSGFGPLNPSDVLKGRRPSGIHDSWASYVTCCLDDHLEHCVKSGAMTEEEAERASDLINGVQATFDPVLLHNDLSPSNIVAEWVIDWENAIAGDPIWELASMCAFRADQPVEPVLEAWHDKPRDLSHRFWVYYLRIALARTVHRARLKLSENSVYPKASRRIQLALSKLTS